MSGPFGQVVGGPAGICQIVWYHNKYIHHKDKFSPFILNLIGQTKQYQQIKYSRVHTIDRQNVHRANKFIWYAKHENNEDTANITNTAH